MKAHIIRKHGEDVPKYQCPHCSAYIAQKRDLGEFKAGGEGNVEISRAEMFVIVAACNETKCVL